MAALGDEIASGDGLIVYRAVSRDGLHDLRVSLWPAPPGGPELAAVRNRMSALRALEHGGIDLPIATGEVTGRTWVIDQVSALPSAAERILVGPVSIAIAVEMIRGVARVLAAMHRRGATHGAINLDTVRSDGIETRIGGAALAFGASIDDDLDALAQLSWSLITGKRTGTPHARTLSELRRVPPALEQLLLSMCAADRASRPQRAEVILRQLDSISAGRPHALRLVAERSDMGQRRGRKRQLGAGSWE